MATPIASSLATITTVPNELLLKIVSYLDETERNRLGRTCKALAVVHRGQDFWKGVLQRLWGEVITRLGLQFPENTFPFKEAVQDFYSRINTIVWEAGFRSKAVMVYGKYQTNMTELSQDGRLLEKALIKTIQKEESIDIFMNIYRAGSIRKSFRRELVDQAAGKGLLNIIEVLLQDNEDHRSKAVDTAAVVGRLDVVQALIQNCSTSEDSENLRGRAVVVVARDGRLDILQALLQNPVSEDHRGWAVVEAVGMGLLDVVLALLQNNAVISPLHRGVAVISAIRGCSVNPANRLEMIQALLQNDAVISQYDRDRALEQAVGKFFFQAIPVLLQNNADITPEVRGQAVVDAAQNGLFHFIPELLQNNATIPPAYIYRAIGAASSTGCLRTMQALLQSLANFHDSAVIIAVEFGHLHFLQLFLQNSAQISEIDRGRAVIKAARRGRLDIIQALLANGHISSNECNIALGVATGVDRPRICELLMISQTP